MLKLFQEYVSNKQYSEAMLVAQNHFNKNKVDSLAFSMLFDFYLLLAKDTGFEWEERQQFLQQCKLTLSYFAENTELTRERVDFIQLQEVKLDKVRMILDDEWEQLQEKQAKIAHSYHEDILNTLDNLIKEVSNATSEAQVKKLAQQVTKLDERFQFSLFTEVHKERYDKITETFQQKISEKIQQLQLRESKKYNINAVATFEKIYKAFQQGLADASTEKMEQLLREFFQYDSALLCNETMIYYNHVLSYLLSQMDDEGKLKLTQCAIMTDKRK